MVVLLMETNDCLFPVSCCDLLAQVEGTCYAHLCEVGRVEGQA